MFGEGEKRRGGSGEEGGDEGKKEEGEGKERKGNLGSEVEGLLRRSTLTINRGSRNRDGELAGQHTAGG